MSGRGKTRTPSGIKGILADVSAESTSRDEFKQLLESQRWGWNEGIIHFPIIRGNVESLYSNPTLGLSLERRRSTCSTSTNKLFRFGTVKVLCEEFLINGQTFTRVGDCTSDGSGFRMKVEADTVLQVIRELLKMPQHSVVIDGEVQERTILKTKKRKRVIEDDDDDAGVGGASSSSAKVPSEPNPSSGCNQRIEDDYDDAGGDWAITPASQLIQLLKKELGLIPSDTDISEYGAYPCVKYSTESLLDELHNVFERQQETIEDRTHETCNAEKLLEALLKQEDAANEKMAALEAENKELKQKVESFRNGTASCAVCLTEKAVYGVVHGDSASGHMCCCETCRGRMRDNSCLVCRVPGTWVRMF
jgi:hypothetical protein